MFGGLAAKPPGRLGIDLRSPVGQQEQEIGDAHVAVAVEVARAGRWAGICTRPPSCQQEEKVQDADRAVAVEIARYAVVAHAMHELEVIDCRFDDRAVVLVRCDEPQADGVRGNDEVGDIERMLEPAAGRLGALGTDGLDIGPADPVVVALISTTKTSLSGSKPSVFEYQRQ